MLSITIAASFAVFAAGVCSHATHFGSESTGLTGTPVPQTKPILTPASPAQAPVSPPPVCVIELFSSEGCSSCPPAEEVANAIAAQAQKNRVSKLDAANPQAARTIVLAFHVDYWDSLGWKDRFASAAFTQRQRDYAEKLKIRGLYTPQMIIGGTSEFVGSDSARANREIAQASGKPAKAQVAAAASWQAEMPNKPKSLATISGVPATPKLQVTTKVTPQPGEKLEGSTVEFILIEDGLVSKVTRGENAGKTLHHDRVVRTFASIPLKADGQAATTIDLPIDAKLANCHIVTVLREPTRWTLLGADEIAVPPQATP